MGKKIPVSLPNGRSWPRKGDAIDHFKAMLGRYQIGSRIEDPTDHSDLVALLDLYDSVLSPNDEPKRGVGIDHFEKRWDEDHPGDTACFFVVRTDGTSIDFSTRRALDVAGKLTSP